jgi:phosphoserine phosphatase RsbU/P
MDPILEGEVGGEILRLPLAQGTYLIGRERHCDLALPDPAVSREHAEVRVEPDRILLRDMGSRNGTWVNGVRLVDQAALQTGDRVRICSVELTLKGRPVSSSAGSRGAESTDRLLVEPESLQTSHRLAFASQSTPSALLSRPEGKLIEAIAEAGRLLAAHQPLEQVFETVLDVVEKMTHARRVLLLLQGEKGGLPVVRAARPPMRPGESILLSRTLIEAVMQGRESLLVTDVSQDDRFREQLSVVQQNIRAALVAPLIDSDQVIGLIYADTGDPRVIYDDEQLQVLTLLAGLIAVKITTTRLTESQRERELLEQELNRAAQIQRSLLPKSLPEVPGYEILALQTPCRQVGGDLYEVMHLPDGKLILVVGDVSGKGMGAAILMSNVSATLRLLAEEDLPLLTLIRRLNLQVQRATEPMHFVTLFIGRLDPESGRLEYVNAGHNPPFLLAGDSPPRELDSTGLPAGLFEDGRYSEAVVDLPRGSLLCVFSDGITEACRDEDFFGEERLLASLQARPDRPLPLVSDGLLSDLNEFLAGGPAGDDMTLLLLRRTS